jgi:hypothetical protein
VALLQKHQLWYVNSKILEFLKQHFNILHQSTLLKFKLPSFTEHLREKNKMLMMLTFKLNGAFKISLHWDWHDSAFLTRSKSNSVSGSWIWSSDIYSTNIITIRINLEIDKMLYKFYRKKKFKSPLTSACREYQCQLQRFVSLICISLHGLSRSTGQ